MTSLYYKRQSVKLSSSFKISNLFSLFQQSHRVLQPSRWGLGDGPQVHSSFWTDALASSRWKYPPFVVAWGEQQKNARSPSLSGFPTRRVRLVLYGTSPFVITAIAAPPNRILCASDRYFTVRRGLVRLGRLGMGTKIPSFGRGGT